MACGVRTLGETKPIPTLAKPLPAGPASWPVVDRPGGLPHGPRGTKPIGRRRLLLPKRTQFAKVSAVGAKAWGFDQTKPISGESRGRQGGEWDAGFCEKKPISDAFRSEERRVGKEWRYGLAPHH